MSQAIFGFLGVIIGAVVTGLADYALQKRRESQALRTAQRMLLLELREGRDFIADSAAKAAWAAEPARVLSNDQWAEHRGILGSAVTDAEWGPVADAFMAIARVRRSNLEARPGTALTPGSEQTATAARDVVEEAIVVLERSIEKSS